MHRRSPSSARLLPLRAHALAERARNSSANPVVYAELPGGQHSFDLLTSIRFEAAIDGIEAFAASAVPEAAT